MGIPVYWVGWESYRQSYLAREFNHVAKLIGINCGATGGTWPNLLTKSVFGDKAVAVYKKARSEEPLQSAKESTHDNPRERLQENANSPPVGRVKSLFLALTATTEPVKGVRNRFRLSVPAFFLCSPLKSRSKNQFRSAPCLAFSPNGRLLVIATGVMSPNGSESLSWNVET